MASRTYDFRAVGAESAARSILALAAANRELAKSERDLAAATRGSRSTGGARSGGGASAGAAGPSRAREAQHDAHVKARAQAIKQAAREEAAALKWANREVERARREKVRAEERALKDDIKRGKEAERAERRAMVEQRRNMRDYERSAAQQARKQAQLARIHSGRTSLTSMIGDRMTGIAGRAVGMLAVGSLVSSGLSTGYDLAATNIKDARRDALGQEKRARALAVAGGDRGSYRYLLNDARAVAGDVRGTKASDVLDAQQRYVAMTGRLDEARSMGGMFSTVARATGGSDESVAATAATIAEKFGIRDAGGMRSTMAALVGQGKQGAFEMSDLAQYLTEMGAAGTRFGLDQGETGVRKLGSLAQFARMSTGSGAEASTGVQAMLRQFTAKSELIKDYNKGKEVVFADKGKTRTNDIESVIANTLKATKGDLGKLQKVFGEEGIKGVSKFISIFNDAQNSLGNGATEAERLAAGEAAVREAFSTMASSAGDWDDVIKDAATQTGDATSKMITVWENVTAKVGDAVGPGFDKLAENASLLVDPLVVFAETAGEAASGLADFTKFLERYGLLDKKAPVDEQQEKMKKLGETDTALAKLSAKPESKLTSREKVQKRLLLTKQDDLRKELGLDDAYAAVSVPKATKDLNKRRLTGDTMYDAQPDIYSGLSSKGAGDIGADGKYRLDPLPAFADEKQMTAGRLIGHSLQGGASGLANAFTAGNWGILSSLASGVGGAASSSNAEADATAAKGSAAADRQMAAAERLSAAADALVKAGALRPSNGNPTGAVAP